MRNRKFLTIASKGFILLSAFSFLSVSLMAFANPQSVMDLVQVELQNNDAYSSIRGVYGGVGLTLFLTLCYMTIFSPLHGLRFLALLWGFYAASRIITIMVEGALGSFGNQWLAIELSFFVISVTLLIAGRKGLTTQISASNG